MNATRRARLAGAVGVAPDRPDADPWWSRDAAALATDLGSGPAGLSAADAARRLADTGPNAVQVHPVPGALRLLWRQFTSPLVLILIAGAVLSLVLREWADAAAILAIIACSALLGFVQELRASNALGRLRARLALTATVRRDDRSFELPVADLVPGDRVLLSAGRLVPADGCVLEARDCQVDQASLTGESFPAEKRPGAVPPETPLAQRDNCLHLGSSVRSGTATLLVVHTGARTQMAELAGRIATADEETDFERGVRRFGELLLRVMFGVVVVVLVANQAIGRPLVDSLLFAMALAVGLSPELLPAIVSVSLARGAGVLAAAGVLVRRLDAIEDLGGIDVLCTDKTGTLTGGVMQLDAAVDAEGQASEEVLQLAFLNAAFESGIANPVDAALVQAGRHAGLDTAGWDKIDELPYDFTRRRLGIVVQRHGDAATHRLITKGAVAEVLAVCTLAPDAQPPLLDFVRRQGERGVRVLAVAWRDAPPRPAWTAADERELRFAGFLCFSDPPKADAAATVQALARRGVRVKMVTGDNRHVAAAVAAGVGLDPRALLDSRTLSTLSGAALAHRAARTDVFAEVDPAQKERIVRALQRSGHAVGYLGDGINDAPALHTADVGISVDGAVDVARESADIVLLQPDLGVLERGIAEGRRTFANTLKYIQITISANFGNMISMAVATPLLPFLPLTATQILLNNLLSDLPSMAISADRVDPPSLRRAQRWNLAEVRRFMIGFGLLSSLFDGLAFVLLLRVFDAGPALFHSGWFVLSVLTELVVLLVLRTRGPAWRSRPARWLAVSTAAVAVLALLLPWSGPLAASLGLVPLPPALLAALAALLVAYVAATEAAKRLVFGRHP